MGTLIFDPHKEEQLQRNGGMPELMRFDPYGLLVVMIIKDIYKSISITMRIVIQNN